MRHLVACRYNFSGNIGWNVENVTECKNKHLIHERLQHKSRQIDFKRHWRLFNNEENNAHDPTSSNWDPSVQKIQTVHLTKSVLGREISSLGLLAYWFLISSLYSDSGG